MKFTIFIISSLILATTANDYCTLCLNHIACRNSGQIAYTCPRNARIVPIEESEIQTILDAHNSLRNLTAGGGKALPKAVKMMRMVNKKCLLILFFHSFKF